LNNSDITFVRPQRYCIGLAEQVIKL